MAVALAVPGGQGYAGRTCSGVGDGRAPADGT
jgi:hypothetical protein